MICKSFFFNQFIKQYLKLAFLFHSDIPLSRTLTCSDRNLNWILRSIYFKGGSKVSVDEEVLWLKSNKTDLSLWNQPLFFPFGKSLFLFASSYIHFQLLNKKERNEFFYFFFIRKCFICELWTRRLCKLWFESSNVWFGHAYSLWRYDTNRFPGASSATNKM